MQTKTKLKLKLSFALCFHELKYQKTGKRHLFVAQVTCRSRTQKQAFLLFKKNFQYRKQLNILLKNILKYKRQ